jgi:allantoate deiminase
VAEAVAASGHRVVRLASGAGHDAVMISRIAPIAMLFVRCAGGVSHHPAESVTAEDVAAAIEASSRFLELVG